MDRNTAKSMRDFLANFLGEFEKEFNVKVSVGSISYGKHSCKIPLEVSEVGKDGTVHDKYAESYKRNAFAYGLDPAWLNTEFVTATGTYTITGLNTRARKFPVMATNKDTGDKYKFDTKSVLFAMGKTPERKPVFAGNLIEIPKP